MPGRALDGLPFLDIDHEDFLSEPWTVARRLDAADGLAHSRRGLEALTYDCATVVLRDPGLAIGFDEMYTASGFADGPVFETAVDSVGNVEGAHHVALRTALASFFTPQRVASLRQVVRTVLADLIDGLPAQGHLNFGVDIADRVPSRLFAHLVGAPPSDAPYIGATSNTLLAVFDMDASRRDQIDCAARDLIAYVEDLVAQRRRSPGSDLVSHLVAAEANGRITHQDIVNNTMAVLRASSDTSSSQLQLTVAQLLTTPGAWSLVREDEAAIPAAVLEATRMRTASWSSMRVAREGATVLGVDLPPGAQAHSVAITAHRDPEAYPDPDTFDATRSAPRPLLNWGQGRHFCLGRPIAVMEMEETVRAMTRRLRHVELSTAAPTLGDVLAREPLGVDIVFDKA